MDALEILDEAKNYWNAIHAAGGELLENSVGKKYLFLQGLAGGAIVDTANGDSIDEQLVALTVDIAGGFLFTFGGPIGKTMEVSLIATGNSPGDYAKAYYKLIKSDDYEYWDYVQNWYDPNTQSIHPYAKILMRKNIDGTYTPAEKAPGVIWAEEVSSEIYNEYIDVQNAFYASLNNTNLDTKIENTNGIFKVTLPTGEIIAEGDNTDNTIIGANKEDYLIGNGGIDTLLGNGGNDYLEGGAGSDTLVGGTGDDIYVANNGDMIFDEDGLGEVYLVNHDPRFKLTGGTQVEVDGNVYKGKVNGYEATYTLDGDTLRVTALGHTVTIYNYNKETSELDIVLADKDPKNISINISDPTVTEGDDGVKLMTFSISASRELSGAESVTLNLTVENFTTDGSDYGSLSASSITLDTSSQTQTVTLEIIGDTEIEDDEDFFLNAEVASKTDLGEVSTLAGIGTIENDDEDPNETVLVKVSDGSRIEMNGEMQFTVSLVGTLNDGETLTVNLSTYDISATAGIDYAGVSGSVTFDSTTSTQTFSVPIKDDNYKESDETFYLAPTSFSYNGVKEIVLENAGVGTIIDDDDNGDVSIEVSSVTALEGDTAGQSAQVTVSISSALSNDIVVSISYGGYVEIAAGSTSGSATITWDGDTIPEEDAILNLEILGFSYDQNAKWGQATL